MSGHHLDYSIERQRHAGFIGRDAVLAELDRLLIEDDTDRWVVVTGEPGRGKSAILAAWLSRRERAGAVVPHHFIRRGCYDWDEPATIARSLAAQVEACYPAQHDPDAQPASRLVELLGRVSARALVPHGDRLVLLVDGLDEYDPPKDAPADPLAAFLPHALPPGVRVLCASRPGHPYLDVLETRGRLTRLDLDDRSATDDNDATVRAFWQREATALGLGDLFIDQAVASAGGNLLHAVILRAHLDNVPPAQRRVETIPSGLDSLLTVWWRWVAGSAVAARGLGILCAAREPLSLDELGVVAGWEGWEGWEDIAQREAFVQTARGVLLEARRDHGAAEYRWHHDAIREHVALQLGPSVIRGHHAALAQNFATWPAASDPMARRYALRHALVHRTEAEDAAAMHHLAFDLSFLEAKCRELGVDDVEADVARAATRCRTQGDAAIARELGDLARALARESHWIHDEPSVLAGQLWNRLRRMGWSAEKLDQTLRLPVSAAEFARVRHVVPRANPALLHDLVGHAAGVNACVVTPDGRRVVSASGDKTIKVWDLATGRSIATFEGHTEGVRGCAVTPDGRRVVSASIDKTLKVWDLTTGRSVATLAGHTEWVSSCAVAPDGQRVVSASGDKTLKVWDLETGRVATLAGHTEWVSSCAVAPDGRRVVSASYDKTLKVWDLATGRVVTTLAGHTEGVSSCAVTPDGRRVVSASYDTTLKVWDLATGRVVATLDGHPEWVSSCAVTPNGRCVISTSGDQSLKVWDLATGRVVSTLEGHTGTVNSCAVTPDGRHVVSASQDKTLKIWDLETYECLATHCGDVAFFPVAAMATTFCAGDRAGTLWFLDWPPSSMPPIATISRFGQNGQ